MPWDFIRRSNFKIFVYTRRYLRLFNEDLHHFGRTPFQMNESNSRWKLGIASVRTLLIGFAIHGSSRWQVEWATERTDERSKCNNFPVLITHLTIDFISFNYAFFFHIFPFHSCGMCEYVKRQHRERCAPFYRQPRNGFWNYFHFKVHMREAGKLLVFTSSLSMFYAERMCSDCDFCYLSMAFRNVKRSSVDCCCWVVVYMHHVRVTNFHCAMFTSLLASFTHNERVQGIIRWRWANAFWVELCDNNNNSHHNEEWEKRRKQFANVR